MSFNGNCFEPQVLADIGIIRMNVYGLVFTTNLCVTTAVSDLLRACAVKNMTFSGFADLLSETHARQYDLQKGHMLRLMCLHRDAREARHKMAASLAANISGVLPWKPPTYRYSSFACKAGYRGRTPSANYLAGLFMREVHRRREVYDQQAMMRADGTIQSMDVMYSSTKRMKKLGGSQVVDGIASIVNNKTGEVTAFKILTNQSRVAIQPWLDSFFRARKERLYPPMEAFYSDVPHKDERMIWEADETLVRSEGFVGGHTAAGDKNVLARADFALPGGGEAFCVVRNTKDTDQRLAHILGQADLLEGKGLKLYLGGDLEWTVEKDVLGHVRGRGGGPAVWIITYALDGKWDEIVAENDARKAVPLTFTCVVHLAQMVKYTHDSPRTTDWPQMRGVLPKTLQRLLNHRAVIWCGKQIGGDRGRMLHHGVPVEGMSILELGRYCKDRRRIPHAGAKLSVIVGALYPGYQKNNDDESRTSNWEQPLSDDQALYAAVDGFWSLGCYARASVTNSVNVRLDSRPVAGKKVHVMFGTKASPRGMTVVAFGTVVEPLEDTRTLGKKLRRDLYRGKSTKSLVVGKKALDAGHCVVRLDHVAPAGKTWCFPAPYANLSPLVAARGGSMVVKLSLLRLASDSPLDTIETAEAEHLARKAPPRPSPASGRIGRTDDDGDDDAEAAAGDRAEVEDDPAYDAQEAILHGCADPEAVEWSRLVDEALRGLEEKSAVPAGINRSLITCVLGDVFHAMHRAKVGAVLFERRAYLFVPPYLHFPVVPPYLPFRTPCLPFVAFVCGCV
jgi:hypothetical protein